MTYNQALTEYLALTQLRDEIQRGGGRGDLRYAISHRIEKARQKIIRTICPNESPDGPW